MFGIYNMCIFDQINNNKTINKMKNSDLPAFAHYAPDDINSGRPLEHYTGLTKREYFAALAMQGLLADPELDKLKVAKMSVAYTDALLKELEKSSHEV